MGGRQSTSTTLGYASTAKQVGFNVKGIYNLWVLIASLVLQVVDAFGADQYLKGKTAIVTGGNSGIGYELPIIFRSDASLQNIPLHYVRGRLETCKALASAGARVILCSRSVAGGEAAVKAELASRGHGGYVVDTSNVVVKALDLNSLPSIKAFADDFSATEDRLDFLILNAGIMALPRLERTDAGFERQIGVNHFGHAYLVQQLQNKMLATPDTSGRVVVLSSVAHTMGSVVPSDLHYKNGRRYAGWEAYGQSKLANLLFAKGLAHQLRGTPITAVSVHPGVIRTNLWK
jgi:NAD(P)-dependent dehydrogenase (short-subunit alcohol dehydrogenase family)